MPAPSEPPTIARSGGALGVRTRSTNSGPDRVADEARSAQRRIGERGGARAEPHREAVGETGSRVLLVDHGRDPRQPGRDDARQRHVAAEADDDTRAVAAHEPVRVPCGAHRARDDSDVLEREPAPEAAAEREHVDREPRLGDHAVFEAAIASDEAHRFDRVAARDELAGERERRVGVTSGTARTEQREHRRSVAGVRAHVGRAAPRCSQRRATLTRMPAAIMRITSDEPPADRNGSGTPETGQHRGDHPDVEHRRADHPRRDARGEQRTETVGRAHRDAVAHDGEHREEPDDHERAEQAELLADDREDEVGLRGGRNCHFARPLPSPTPVTPPLPSAMSDCEIW